MERIRRFFKRLGKGLKNKGYTLVEVAAVVAVTAGLTAVVVPVAVEKAKDSKLAGAKMDCVRIAEAIIAFVKDTGEWPAYSSAGRDQYYVLRSGSGTVGPLETDKYDPQGASALWGSYYADLLDNHLVKDNPGGVQDGYKNTHKLNWKGPYAESFNKRDPWGNNYLVWIKAMHTPSGGSSVNNRTTKEYGWIISAGPNGILETDETSGSLVNDDIGIMLYAAEKGR